MVPDPTLRALAGGLHQCTNGTAVKRPPHRFGMGSKGGFTLIEIMVSIAIVATLAAIAIPQYISYMEKARVARAIAEVKNIEKAVYNYFSDHDEFPDSLRQVGFGGYQDPWGNAYRYLRIDGGGPGIGHVRKDHSLVPVNSDFDLYSMGRDGASQSAFTSKASQDDIVRANNGGYVGLVSNY
jgi:general secretion pathway protein G